MEQKLHFISRDCFAPVVASSNLGWKLSRIFYVRTWVHCHATLKSTNERFSPRRNVTEAHRMHVYSPYLRWRLTKTRESAQYRYPVELSGDNIRA